MLNIAGVILAAGKGTRMNEGSASPIPKVMFPLLGEPMIDLGVNKLKEVGADPIVCVVGYKKELIKDHLKDKVLYAVQEEQLGTGHAVMMARDLLKGKNGSVIVCYGDMPLYKTETIKKLIELYERKNAASAKGEAVTPAFEGMQGKPTIAMLSVNFFDPDYWAYGRIIRNKDKDVEAIVEQKDCSPEQRRIKECNSGFYIFDSRWLWENIEKLNNDNVQKEYLLTDLIKMAKDQNKKVIAMPVSEEWEALGINTQEQRAQAEKILRKI